MIYDMMYFLTAIRLTPGGSSTVQYSTVQYSTVQYSTVQYSTVHIYIQTVYGATQFAN